MSQNAPTASPAALEATCGDLAAIIRQQGFEIERLRALLQRRTDALHNIAIGGNGDRYWTLDEVRAVAWDAYEAKP